MTRKVRKSDAPRGSRPADALDQQVHVLLHELQVHTEEITVQNEQLLKAQIEIEEARDRYADLYDFAPIGYVTLDRHGVIKQLNIAATALFGRDRSYLAGMPLLSALAAESREPFLRFLAEAHNPANRSANVEVMMRTDRRRVLRLIAREMKSRTGASELFTAVIDVTAEHQLRHENEILLESERAKSAQLSAENTKQLAAEERIKALLERLVNVQEAERRRLALNLHDHLGQQLTALRLTLSALRDAKNAPDRTSRFETVERIVAQLDRDVDFLAWELRPAALDDVGLQAALGEFTRQWAAANGVAADYHHTGVDAARLPPEVESHLYRIVQEALNNISKHAQATHVSVLLERKANELTLIVEDDGCGFEVGDELSRLRKGGMGLAGIRERTALVGGESELESTPGKGTTLFIRIPVAVGSKPGSPQTRENP